ncbi:hypothetical protein FRB90_007438 [Tulasnella sp. 427]|nr:hypothetical protein FRB90_007438 [Tulasnella sp. 427]
MRCVSMLWNNFLVSGPRYWQAVNLRTRSDKVRDILKRSENTPLCVYSIQGNDLRSSETADLELIQRYLSDSAVQIRTIRSEERHLLPLWKALFRASTPLLESLSLTAQDYWSVVGIDTSAEWLVIDLPSLRAVTARGWQPPADATWLANLRNLTFLRPTVIDMNLLNVLSRSTGLIELHIEADDFMIWNETPLSNTPKISLPQLRNLNIALFDTLYDVRYLIRRLDFPPDIPASLQIANALNSDELIEDMAHFIFPSPPDHIQFLHPPPTATLEVHATPGNLTAVTYSSGSRSVKFGVTPHINQWPDRLQDIILALQTRLNNPQLAVQVDTANEPKAEVLRRMTNVNITSMCIRHGVAEASNLDGVIAAIASRHHSLPAGQSMAEEQNWPFEALRELTFEKTDISLAVVTRLVGIRHSYLRRSSKKWVKRVVLRECILRGMAISRATAHLKDLGVELVAEGCKVVGKGLY